MKRIPIAVISVLVLSTSTVSVIPVSAESNYNLNVTVDTTGYRRSISPYIYGINNSRKGEIPPVTTFSARQGGNRYSAYNWETNASSAGADWEHYSDAYLINFKKDKLAIPGSPALDFARDMATQNTDYKITTLQMAGYVSADMDGAVTEDEIAPSNRWIPVRASKNAPFSLVPDTEDNCVYMDEYVNYLVQTLGDSGTKTGFQGYSLDNEPSIWSGTHGRMHPVKSTCGKSSANQLNLRLLSNPLTPMQKYMAVCCMALMRTGHSTMLLTGKL